VRLDERYDSTAEPEKRIDPIPGKDVKLTIDLALQNDIYKALLDPAKHLLRSEDAGDTKNHFVALVIMSLDGQVLSMISLPTYNPNAIDTLRAQLNADEANRPLANRALQSYQPGSTVKPLLASAALTEGVITPETTITCNGYLFPNRPGSFRCSIYVETNGRATHGPLQLVDAIAQSCNIYFYNVGRMLGLEKLNHWFALYGLGSDTGFELPESDGFIPTTQSLADPDAAKTEALFLGIGQGQVNATPLQMANAYATLLRGGLTIAPRLLFDAPQTRKQLFTLDPTILATVKAGMRAVITRGTAKEIFAGFHLPIAGKTGTADTSRPAFDDQGRPLYDTSRPRVDNDGKPLHDAQGKPIFSRVSKSGTDAWFISYAPASDSAPPKFIIAAVMEFGGYGGKAAAPMVKQALLELEKHHYLEALDVDTSEAMR
jgi:penicillin-binding protein 2